MAVASTDKVILGSIAFAVFWILAVFPTIPFLPIGRTAGALLGAMLMVIFHVLTPEQAYDAIDLPILGLLFGTMVVSIYLERAYLFKYLGILLTWRSQGPKDLMFRVCLVSAISSALFTNDTSCVVLTEFVLKIARQHNLPPHILLLALASSANIGSAATPIGNPQNLVIAVKGKIPFLEFVVGVFPAMLVGIAVNVVILLCVYWRLLSSHKNVEDATSDLVSENDVYSHRFSPATMSYSSLSVSQELIPDGTSIPGSAGMKDVETLRNCIHASENEIHSVSSVDHFETARYSIASKGAEANGFSQHMEEMVNSESFEVTSDGVDVNLKQIIFGKEVRQKWLRLWRNMSVYLVTLGMLIALLLGLNMSWTALTAALALVVLDFKDARPCLEKVSYSLLTFFCGMFITVDGFNKTGIPSQLWVLVQPYAKVDHAGGIAILGLVILFLSNLASNVPTVLLLGSQVAASAAGISAADEKKAWLILAWVSTVAGNLSLLGSAANLIVCEQARRAPHLSYDLTFWNHLKFGVPSTLIVTAIGLTVIRG